MTQTLDLSVQKAPPRESYSHLRPSDRIGLFFVVFCSTLTTFAVFLSQSQGWLSWLAGQVLLALALLQWFILLHEAGHNTLFRTHRANRYAGYLAGFFALIPFNCWKAVHARHHRWTGWQDLDLTTATLVPRPLTRLERLVANICWATGVPLFSLLYRLNNYWNGPRLAKAFPQQRNRLILAMVLLLTAYGVMGYVLGWRPIVQSVGLGLLLSLAIQDPLILSQHTHVPMHISQGQKVSPFTPREQEVFTRSLRFPNWFSACMLLHFDAHELHHMYPRVPGYYLRRISYIPHNEVHWWDWLRKAKRVPGAVFLFSNRLQSGLDV